MRIHFENLTRPKLVAKSLRKALKGVGHELSLARCLEAVAAMYGYRDWHELTKAHAAMPASPDDGECPDDVVAARRVQYGAAIAGLGIGAEHVGHVLDGVRPSDRSAAGSQRPGGMPRLLVEAFETDEEGNDLRSLGMQDLTDAVVRAMCPSPSRHVREIEMPPMVMTLQSGLSEEARRLGYGARLALTGFGDRLEEFIVRIGGRALLPDFRKRLDEASWVSVLLRDAEKELAAVRAARFEEDASRQVMVHLSHDARDYADSPDDAYGYWQWHEYTDKHPVPGWDREEDRNEWWVRYHAWTDENAPPFVFGTLPDPWQGVNAEDLRIEARDVGEINLPAMLEGWLEVHYEGAYDDVVDERELEAIVKEWLPHAGWGNAEDKALEGKVSAWNARQNIVAYVPDFGTVLPTGNAKTHADAIAWCERHVAGLRRRLDELSRWQPAEARSAEGCPKAMA